MSYSAKTVANYFLERAWQEGRNLDPMQIQKLVYIAHGWHLAKHGTPLVTDTFEAWRYGPVQRELYQTFKRYGAGYIRSLASEGLRTPTLPSGANQERLLLESVWRRYGRCSGIQLSSMTHEANTPWARAWDPSDPNSEISNDVIADYYRHHHDYLNCE